MTKQKLSEEELARLINTLEASLDAGVDTPAQHQAADFLSQVEDIGLPAALQESLKRIKAWRQANQQAGGKASAGATREKILTTFADAKSAQELLLQYAVTPGQKQYLADPGNAKSLLRMRQVADALLGNGKLPQPAIHAYNGMKRASQPMTSDTIANITGNSGSLSAIRNALRAFVWLGLARASHNTDGSLVTSFRGTSFELTEEGKEILGKLI